MKAEDIADLLHARRIGRDRWQARCPAHDDRHPSLTLTQGERGVLLRCWSHGCTPESITSAIGLTMRHLFDDAPLAPALRAGAAREKAARDERDHKERAADREKRARIFKLERVADALGAKLACRPDDRELGRLFHLTCDRLHEVDMPGNQDGPIRLPEPSAVPGWIHDALMDLAQSFDRKETARCERAA